jgi:cation transport regulator
MTQNSTQRQNQQSDQPATDRPTAQQNPELERQENQSNKASQDQQASDNTPQKMGTDEQNTSQSQGKLTSENLPQDVRDALPEEAQSLFMAAYNSVLDNNGDERAAARIAWQTIETNEHYERGEDGKWHRLADDAGYHSPIHETSS